MPAAQLLSQLAYANHRKLNGLPGASHAAVAKAIKSGRLVKCLRKQPGGKVLLDPVAADQEWADNTNGVMQRSEQAESKTPRSHQAPESQASESPTLASQPRGGDAGTDTLADARAMKEKYLALMARLEYELESGKLIESEAASRAAFSAARKARDMLLTIADRLAPVVAGLSDQFECHRVITSEVRRVCDELSANPIDKLQQQKDKAGQDEQPK